jgi:autophagy-related protein 5
LIPRLASFFARALITNPPDLTAVWFSFEEVPLKWHYPIGLLFDLYSPVKDDLIVSSTIVGLDSGDEEESENLPWRLTIHLSNFPETHLIRLDTEGLELKDKFNNSVKEASYIRHGTNKVVMSLGKEPTTQLWLAVETGQFESKVLTLAN